MAATQILIAQASADEDEMAAWLSAQFTLLALPRFMDSSEPEAAAMGECPAPSQVLFLADHRAQVLAHVCEVSSQGGRFHVDPVGARGLTIQWKRTRQERHGKYIASDSRIQFDLDDSSRDSARTGQVFSALTTHLKTAYPKMSIAGTPVYVGPHLAAAIDGGEATLTAATGTVLALKPNPKCRG